MLPIIVNILYVLIAIGMTVLILLQRGAGAGAGAGFGGGASGTVFGARGSANFLSRSTAVLAALFFIVSLGMGMFLSKPGVEVESFDDLGVMSSAPAVPAADQDGDVPSAVAPQESVVPVPADEVPPAAVVPDAVPPEPAASEEDTPPAG